ncbi:MAG: J domain-containing protein [Proteobacteria bacterium]|nr:J domain-containing protein [Pseudomonadota bacterium]
MSETRDRFTCSTGKNTATTPCAWDGCAAAGEYRAPRDRRLADYVMYCLEHVRAYNARWDFHAGSSVADLEAEIRSAATWERPTWKLGTLGAGYRAGRPGARVNDPFGFAAGTDFEDKKKARAEDAQSRATPGGATARMRAMKVLDLSGPVTLETLKERYKALVKKYHPDANGGSAEAENRMKVINAAYQTLRAGLAAAT